MQDDRALDRHDSAMRQLGIGSKELNALRSINPNTDNIIIILADGTVQKFELSANS